MLEVRYNKTTKEVTGWCGDETQLGSLDRDREDEAIVILDIPIPDKLLGTWLCDGNMLIPNPDYIDPDLPSADDIRVSEILSHAPDVITPVEMGETLKIFGKRLGFKFD